MGARVYRQLSRSPSWWEPWRKKDEGEGEAKGRLLAVLRGAGESRSQADILIDGACGGGLEGERQVGPGMVCATWHAFKKRSRPGADNPALDLPAVRAVQRGLCA